jgi:hypothetical protein
VTQTPLRRYGNDDFPVILDERTADALRDAGLDDGDLKRRFELLEQEVATLKEQVKNIMDRKERARTKTLALNYRRNSDELLKLQWGP